MHITDRPLRVNIPERDPREQAVRDKYPTLDAEVLTSLRELTALYSGMTEASFWSTQVRAKVERARAALAKVDHAR